MSEQNYPPQDPNQPGGPVPPPGQYQGGPGQYPGAPGPQGYQQAPGYGPGPGGDQLSPSDQRMWAALTHAAGILFWFIPALVVYLIQKDRGAFIADQAKEALNFQIMLTIGYVISYILMIVFIGFLTYIALVILGIVLAIMAALAANRGENYRYPINLRLIK